MNITRENINELNATITVKIEKNDYETAVSETLKDYRKKVNMPGFRPGHVPAGLVKKMYGKAILADEVNKVLSNQLTKYMVDEKLNILGEPLPNEEKQPAIDFENATDFEFVFDIAMAPEVDVKLDKRKKVPYYIIDVDTDMVNKQVESYTSRFGKNEAVEAADEKSTLRGDFAQLDADGNELEGGIKAEDVVIAIDTMKAEAVKAEAIGKKAGDVLVFDPVKAYDSKHEVGHMLNVSHEEAENIEGNFKFTVTEVLSYKPAEINGDLFVKAFGETTDVKTEEEFRNKLKAEIAENFNYSSEYKFTIDARDALVEKFNAELPVEFLKRWLKATNNELTEDQIDNDFDNFTQDLRWQLIKDRLVRENELKIEEADVKALAKRVAAMQFSQYGMYNVQDEYLENYAGHILQNEEERKRLANKALEDKIMELIKSKITLDEKSISYDEFNKLLEK